MYEELNRVIDETGPDEDMGEITEVENNVENHD